MFILRYHSYDEIRSVQDRLRWCRHHAGLMQKDVADKLGISRSLYIDYEVGAVDYYPGEIVDRLASLYGVPASDFLDAFNRFLYYGQGKAIREHRERLGLPRKTYARYMGIDPNSLRAWESGRKRIMKNSWEKYFKGVIEV